MDLPIALEAKKGRHDAESMLCGICFFVLAAMPAYAQQSDTRVADLVQSGKLRIGVFPSFQFSKDPATGHPRVLPLALQMQSRNALGWVTLLPLNFQVLLR